MPLGERKERHAGMIKVLKQNDITAWRTRFVDALMQANANMKSGT
jgi:trehalose-6-phosphate synthase